MKPDITGKKDIVIIMQFFYEKAKADKVIGHFFTDVVEVNWEKHIPTMSAFWENVLFYTGEYDGNPLDAHKKIHKMLHLPSILNAGYASLMKQLTSIFPVKTPQK